MVSHSAVSHALCVTLIWLLSITKDELCGTSFMSVVSELLSTLRVAIPSTFIHFNSERSMAWQLGAVPTVILHFSSYFCKNKHLKPSQGSVT